MSRVYIPKVISFQLANHAMGCMNSKVEAEDKEAARINAGIEKQIRNDKKTYDRTVKILLLGLYQPSVLNELTAH